MHKPRPENEEVESAVDDEEVQTGSEESKAPYTLRTGPGEFNMVGDPCPECNEGILVETDMGLDCDSCSYAIVDPKKFPTKEAE
jgi:hypothetical protein